MIVLIKFYYFVFDLLFLVSANKMNDNGLLGKYKIRERTKVGVSIISFYFLLNFFFLLKIVLNEMLSFCLLYNFLFEGYGRMLSTNRFALYFTR